MYDQTTFSILEIRINDMSTYIAVIQDYIFKICIQCMHLLFNHQFSYLIYCISLTMLHMYIEIYTITCTSQIHHTCSSHRCQNNHVIISVQVFLSLSSCTFRLSVRTLLVPIIQRKITPTDSTASCCR